MAEDPVQAITRENLLDASKDDENRKLLDLLKKHQTKDDPFDVRETLETLSNAQLNEFWDGLRQKTTFAVFAMHDAKPGDETESILNCVIIFGMATLSSKESSCPQGLFESTIILEEMLQTIPENLEKLKNSVAKLCESYWISKVPDRQDIGANTLIYLFHRAIKDKGTLADVKRIWLLRERLSSLDFNNESSDIIKDCLVKSIQCNVFIKSEQGRKLLSTFFEFDDSLIEILHNAVKSNFCFCSKTMAEWYGEIYFRAWKVAEGQSLQKIEKCVQDFMFHAINTKRRGALTPLLRKLLGYFHQQKKLKGVDEMLLRLYDPIIWRSFKVANSNVRANAIGLLVDVFPLQNPDAGVAEIDKLLQSQFDILDKSLDDPCQVVRCVAVEGVCYICNKYWDMIPSQTSQDLLYKLIQNHARDGASADVRLAVVNGLILLLDNFACQPLLKTILPETQNLFHDSAEKVRISMCELLIKVKKLRSIKFYSIVPAPHLLARIEIDSTPVVRRLVSLLFDNYMPEQKETESSQDHRAELLHRCMSLVDSNPGAARQFYKHAIKHMGLSRRVQFMTLLCRCVLETVRRADQDSNENENTGVDEQNEAANEGNEDELSVNDVDTLNGLLEIIVIMWTGSMTDMSKPENKENKEVFEKKMSKAIPEFLRVFQDSTIISTLTMLAGLMPSSLVPVCSTLSKLKAFKRGEHTEEEYGMMLECLCKWNKADDLLELIAEWLQVGLNVEKDTSAGKGRKRSRAVAFVDPIQPQPMLALDYLKHMIQQVISREILLRSYRKDLENIVKVLKRSKTVIITRLTSEDSVGEMTTDEFLMQTYSMYLKLEILLHNTENDHDSTQSFEEVIKWLEEDVIPLLKSTAQPKKKKSKRRLGAAEATLLMDPTMSDQTMLSETILSQTISNATMSETLLESIQTGSNIHGNDHRNFACEIIESTLQISCNVLLVGIANRSIGSKLAGLISSVLTIDEIPRLLPTLSKLMNQLTLIAISYKWNEEDDFVPGMVNKFILTLDSLVKNRKGQAERVLPALKPAFGSLLNSYFRNYLVEDCNTDIISNVLAAVVSELTAVIKTDPHCEAITTISKLPMLSAFILSIVVKKSTMASLLASESKKYLNEIAQLEPERIVAILQLVNLMSKERFCVGDLKDCVGSLEDRMNAINLDDVSENAPIREIVTTGRDLLANTKSELGVVP